MEVHYGVRSFTKIKNPVITVGTFDGVHLGHQKILNKLEKIAEKIDGETVLLTFEPHPRKVLFKNQPLKLINTLEEKIKLLDSYGLDHLVVYPFTQEFSNLSARSYIEELLIKKLKIHTLVIGYDHHFGNDRQGNIELLKKVKTNFNFELVEISAHEIDEIKVSSTKIRSAINTGKIGLVKDYSGKSFHFSGKIVKGEGIGKKLEHPTANIEIQDNDKIIPANGVYAIKCCVNNAQIDGVMNIGNRPTIDNNETTTIECHLFNWSKDIYGETMEIDVVEKIRNEVKFPSMDILKRQIELDCIKAQKVLNEEI